MPRPLTQIPKYALVDEVNGKIIETIGDENNDYFHANDAYDIADAIRPNWRAEGLKLWLRVGQQS